MICTNPCDNTTNPTVFDIVGRYTTNYDVMLEGKPQALHHLAVLLMSNVQLLKCVLQVPRFSSPAPYEGFLTTLCIIQQDGAIQIKREDNTLVIAGSGDKLSML